MRVFGVPLKLSPILLLMALLLASGDDAAAAPGTTTRVSVNNLGFQGDNHSEDPAVTTDGRYVAFSSSASNLVTGDTQMCGSVNCADIFVHDRQTGDTTRVSVNSAGVQGNNGSSDPAVSADGRYVAFSSSASNLVTGDSNGLTDIFVHDRQTGVTTRVSMNSAGVQGNDGSFAPAFSADGRYVAFSSSASNLVTGDSNGRADIFVYDRQTGVTTRVSVNSAGVQGNGASLVSAFSADGRYVAFSSHASNLVTGDTQLCGSLSCVDIFVHDRQTGVTTRVSVNSAGVQGNNGSSDPAVSADGRYVAFPSSASNLVTGDSNGWPDTFVHDRQTGVTTRASVNSAGVQGDNPSSFPAMSGDGRYVAFSSSASNLVAGDSQMCGSFSCTDIFVQDRQTGVTTRVSVNSAGDQANGQIGPQPAVSGDGRSVAFWAPPSTTNLVAGDTNNASDVFVHQFSDSDADGEWDPFDACPSNADCDSDGFGDGAEMTIGTNPLAGCGADAWPADIDNDGFADISDLIFLTGSFGSAVPPAPARYNIGEPRNAFVDITDIVRMLAFFGKRCGE